MVVAFDREDRLFGDAALVKVAISDSFACNLFPLDYCMYIFHNISIIYCYWEMVEMNLIQM